MGYREFNPKAEALKRNFIPILMIILVLASVTTPGCALGIRVRENSPTPKQSTAELERYTQQASPIMKRHTDTTETTNQANRAFLKVVASGNQKEVLKALTTYVDTLDWALSRVDSELLDFKKLIPPPEARTFHSLMIEGLTKEQDGLANTLSYYSSVLRYGFGDSEALNRGNDQLLEAQKIWLQVQYELQDLLQKATNR
jgi:hypothetical protein